MVKRAVAYCKHLFRFMLSLLKNSDTVHLLTPCLTTLTWLSSCSLTWPLSGDHEHASKDTTAQRSVPCAAVGSHKVTFRSDDSCPSAKRNASIIYWYRNITMF